MPDYTNAIKHLYGQLPPCTDPTSLSQIYATWLYPSWAKPTEQQLDTALLDYDAAQLTKAITPDDIALAARDATEATYISNVRARWAGYAALKGKTPDEIFTIVQGVIDGWTTLGQAKADLRVWIPLIVATLAWEIEKDSFRNGS